MTSFRRSRARRRRSTAPPRRSRPAASRRRRGSRPRSRRARTGPCVSGIGVDADDVGLRGGQRRVVVAELGQTAQLLAERLAGGRDRDSRGRRSRTRASCGRPGVAGAHVAAAGNEHAYRRRHEGPRWADEISTCEDDRIRGLSHGRMCRNTMRSTVSAIVVGPHSRDRVRCRPVHRGSKADSQRRTKDPKGTKHAQGRSAGSASQPAACGSQARENGVQRSTAFVLSLASWMCLPVGTPALRNVRCCTSGMLVVSARPVALFLRGAPSRARRVAPLHAIECRGDVS